MSFCTVCGRPENEAPHRHGADSRYDTPRHCSRCGRRLDVQVLPLGYRATCRACDGTHPARSGGAAIERPRTAGKSAGIDAGLSGTASASPLD